MFIKYRKFWVAAVAAVLIGLNSFFDIGIPYEAETIVNTVIALLAAVGVHQAPNTETA